MWSACCTVAVLQVWVRRLTQPAVGLLAGVVLATSFAFVYVHAGRSGNTDSLFTLLILLTVISLWAARDRPWRIVWVGPLAAAVFLLKGMAVLMPLSIVLAVETWRLAHRRRREWIPVTCALLLFVVPIGAWIWARWQLDQSRSAAQHPSRGGAVRRPASGPVPDPASSTWVARPSAVCEKQHRQHQPCRRR